MKNNELIILTEENITEELLEKAFNSTMGLHYETDSKKVRSMMKAYTAKTLAAKRAQ